ncbi:MAG: molybdenum cofactor biosynthesis protein B [Nitrospinota bacterium]
MGAEGRHPHPPGERERLEEAAARKTYEEHRREAPESVACYIITVSDTRTPESDTSGQIIMELLKEGGHRVAGYAIVRDEPAEIQKKLDEVLSDPGVQAILTNGGTGIARRDTTYDVIVRNLEKRVDGFGELFRYISFQEIGPPAMLSRAVAGVCRGKLVAAMPGSGNACKTAMTRLLLPELAHMVRELTK